MSMLIERAKAFAIGAHEAVEQKRKYTGEPYWIHPEEVAAIVRRVGGTEAMIAAAWLHDVVEDTGVAIETLQQQFGGAVSRLVADLTDVSMAGEGPRSYRRTLDRLHTAEASADAQTIKLADLIANSSTIMAFNPGFARTYLVEKWLLLKVLTQGDVTLHKEATDLLEANRNALGMTVDDVVQKAKPYEQHEAAILLTRENQEAGLYDTPKEGQTQ